ncbi:MAG: leucine-rich repeat protein [Clostridia bacterium]|nr:leucine-rich repeat protein [Clostridia bacterium]
MKKLRFILGILLVLFCFWCNPWTVEAAAKEDVPYDKGGVAFEYRASLAKSASAPTNGFESLEDGGAYLREQLVARETFVSLRMRGSFASDCYTQLFEIATRHTGNPKEGDYILANLIQCTFSSVSGTDEDGAYTDVSFAIEWLPGARQEVQVDAAVSEILNELNLWDASDYDKVKGIYDWITENITYDYDWDDTTSEDLYKHSTHAAVMTKTAVCQGIASLYYRLSLELGVDCRYISGVAGQTEQENHAWNIVCLEGKYYHMDPTWDLGMINVYRYFLVSGQDFPHHYRSEKFDTEAFHALYPMAELPYVQNVTASGTIGSKIQWVLDGDTGTLTVNGSGAIPSYRYTDAPWKAYRDSVTAIVVGEGITEVGERAFYWCKNCTQVTLPDSLVAIRQYGFNNLRSLQAITLPKHLRIIESCGFSECTALKSIVLPDSVTTVGSSAFSNCSALTSVTLSAGMTSVPNSIFFGDRNLRTVVLPESITSIQDTAFMNSGIRQITLPAKVTSLGTACFAGCTSLQNIYVEAGNPAYKSVNGVLYTADGTHLICYPAARYGSYVIPEGTVYVDYDAFRESDVTAVTFPSTLTKIDDYAFSWCPFLKSVTFPQNITYIGDSAFRNCTTLTGVTFQNESVFLEGYTFAGCKALKSVVLPSKLTSIPNGLFDDCIQLASIDIPSTVGSIGSTAFFNCDKLISVTIPGNVRSIGQQAFDYCQNLTVITMKEGVRTLDWIAVRNAPNLTKVVIPASVTTIDKENFENCPKAVLYVTCGTAGRSYAVNNGLSYVSTHAYTSTVTPPTCTAQGYTTHTCPCGDSYVDSYVSATGHNYKNGICTACGAENPNKISLHYDDYYDVSGKSVEIANAGTPTSYQVGYGVAENSVRDSAVVSLQGDTLIATGIGNATVKIDGVLYEVTVEPAPISLLLLIGQSNMRGSEGNANQSIICPDGMVYSTYGDDRGADNIAMTVSNAAHFVPSALTGEYRNINTIGTTDCLSGYPVYSLTEAGAGKIGPDSGFAYEWVRQTGEKVWVVNAAHGGTSINVWQPGTTEYEQCRALFTACQETLRKEIAAGHFTLSHMAYFWCQGCSDRAQSAQWYVDKYLTMHEGLKSEMSFDHDTNPNTADKTFEFGGIIPVRVGSTAACYRDGVYSITNSYAYHESFVDLRFSGPRVAQYWMINNPELPDIWGVCDIGDDWVWMPDGTNGVSTYFQTHYPNGRVDYTTQVTQKESWYTPTTPAAVHDSVHYDQIGYNEYGREAVRNALIMLGEIEAPEVEPEMKLISWDGYTEVAGITASTTGHSGTLVVPKVYPIWKSKEETYELSEGLSWDYYDLLAVDAQVEGTLTVGGKTVHVAKAAPGAHYEEHLSELPKEICCGLNLWNVLPHDSYFYSTGTNWGIHSSGNVYSVTIPVNPGERIFATAFGKAVENGHATANGIRVTFFSEYGVAKTLAPAECYSEFTANGGYLTAPEGTTAVNIAMWNNSDDNEIYLLDRAHDTNSGICGICGKDSHVHLWSDWEMKEIPGKGEPVSEERICSGCGETEIREIESVWQKYNLVEHYSDLPKNVCSGLNLWNILVHDKYYFANGINWAVYSSGSVCSVTIPVNSRDQIFATAFGKAGENGHATSDGIRVTFFSAYGVVKTMSPAECYAEFSANGGYLIAPENAIAINVAMWNNSDENELYILNREHNDQTTVTPPTCTAQGYTTHTCTVCGDSYVDTYVPATRKHTYKNGICSGCGAAVPSLKGRTLSILGASISTFAGTSNGVAADTTNSTIRNNAIYYPSAVVSDVTLTDTWWMQACNDLGLQLLVNNSWSGSSLLHTRNGTVGAYVDRCLQLHDDTGENAGEEPDIIAIQMGTNDFQYYKDTLGTANIDYASLITQNRDGTFAYGVPATSLEAAAIVLHKISVRYPNAEVYYLNISQRVDGTDALIQSFNAELKKVVEHFGAHIVDIYGSAITMESFATYIGDGRVHPNKLGMDAYTEAFKAALLANTVYTAQTHKVSMDLSGVTADYGDDKLVIDGDRYVVNLTTAADMGLKVTVTMGGKDITHTAYADGTVIIDAVTADVTITAKSVYTPKNYRWVFDGSDLVCIRGENGLTKNAGTTVDGVFSNTRYALENAVVLLHNLPWVVEWQSEGSFQNSGSSSGARIFTSTDVNASHDARYIFKSNTNGIVAMGEKTSSGSHNYGIALGDHGIDWTELHTYRLENRIASDGSNRIYLFVDGNEIGAMTHYYIGTKDQSTTSDWLSGKDFVFPYMGTDTHGFTNASIAYIAVMEGGCTHSYTSVVTPPTCTAEGYTTHTCAVCGESYTDAFVPATGHTPGAAATCTEAQHCTVCTAELEPALGHALTQHAAKPATCTDIGWNAYETCSRCDHSTYSEIPAAGHNYTHKVTAPTCTAQGYTTHTCHCGDTYVDSYVNATGHNFDDWYVTKASTEAAQGEKRRDCVNCDCFETTPVAALTHDHNRWDVTVLPAVLPTCTTTGLTEGQKCSGCGEILVAQEVVPALSHNFGTWARTKAPTCTETGTEHRDCQRCDHFETRSISALGHDLTNHAAKPATCTGIGWDAYETCSRCDLSTYKELPALGHDLTNHAAKPATCTDIGWNAYETCSRCDHSTYKELPALSHDLTQHVAKPATCTDIGWNAYETCSRCDHSTYSEIPATGHRYTHTVVPPTTDAEGYTLHTCRSCGSSYKDNYVDRLPSYVPGDVMGDTEVDSDDAIYLLKHTLFPEMYPINQTSDFDGNGTLNSDDAIYLLKYTLFPDLYPLHGGGRSVYAMPVRTRSKDGEITE